MKTIGLSGSEVLQDAEAAGARAQHGLSFLLHLDSELSHKLTSRRVFPSGRTDWYGNGATGEIAYTVYDAYGRLTRSVIGGGAYTDRTYDGWGRVQSITHRSLANAVLRSESYVYDPAGRPTSIGGRALNWDDEDRLVSSPGAVPGAQVYNGDGARVQRGSAKIRRAGSSVTSPVLSDGPGRRVVPGLGEATDPYYFMVYLQDRLGSTGALTDGSGNGVHARLETDAFGAPLSRWREAVPNLSPCSSPSWF